MLLVVRFYLFFRVIFVYNKNHIFLLRDGHFISWSSWWVCGAKNHCSRVSLSLVFLFLALKNLLSPVVSGFRPLNGKKMLSPPLCQSVCVFSTNVFEWQIYMQRTKVTSPAATRTGHRNWMIGGRKTNYYYLFQ